MRHNVVDIGSEGEFQNEIIVRVVQEWPPAKTDGVLLLRPTRE